MMRLANPDNLDTTLRPRRTAGRGPRCGPARVTTLLEEVIAPRPTADGAYDWMPADDAGHGLEVDGAGGAGGGPGAAAPARAGAE